jgi:hypothetical protein
MANGAINRADFWLVATCGLNAVKYGDRYPDRSCPELIRNVIIKLWIFVHPPIVSATIYDRGSANKLDMNSSDRSLTRSYSQEDVQQILNIALAQHPSTGTELSYAQLLEIADELRIAPDTLKQAENKWLTQQGASAKIQEFETHRRSKLQDKFGKYAITNACLVALNLLTGFGVPWSLYVLIFWGMGVGLDAWKFFYQRQGDAYNRAFQNWERKRKIQKSITGLIDKLV